MKTRSALGGAMMFSALFRRLRQAESVSRVVGIKATAEGGKFGFRVGTRRVVVNSFRCIVYEYG